MDEVFGTTEVLLKSLKDLQARQQRHSVENDMQKPTFYEDDTNITHVNSIAYSTVILSFLYLIGSYQ